MSYRDMTWDEYKAMTLGLYNNGSSWVDFYWAACPPITNPVRWLRFHLAEESRDLRWACREFGGFDPLYPVWIKEI